MPTMEKRPSYTENKRVVIILDLICVNGYEETSEKGWLKNEK